MLRSAQLSRNGRGRGASPRTNRAPRNAGSEFPPAGRIQRPAQPYPLAANFGTSFWKGPRADFPASVNAFDRFFQALAAVGTFGVSGTIHHEPPRRLSVAGTNIQPGATLTVRLPYPSGIRSVTLDVNPVRDGAGQIRWETNATLAPRVHYALLCGWFAAPSVQTTWITGVDAGLAPATFNSSVQFTVNNENPAGPQSSALASGLAIQ